MRTTKEVEDVCRKLKPIIGDKADKLFYMYLAEDEMDRKSIILDIEVIAEKLLKKKPLENQKILLDPPPKEESSGNHLLGDVIYNDKQLHPLYLRNEDYIKQVCIFGITGEGKSNLASSLALQLLKSKTPFMIIDWKRSWRNILSLKDKIPELKDVQVFTIGRKTLPFLWNPFRKPPGSDQDLWINTIADALERSHISGQGVAYHLNTIYPELFKGITGNYYPNFHDGKRVIKNVKASLRELQWKQTALRIFHSFTVGSASKSFNARCPIKFEELLNKPVILELDIEMPENLRIFFSEMVLRWIHLYRLSHGETDRLRHVLFLEEVHNLFNKNGFDKENSSLENIYRQIRSTGQGIVSLTQHPSKVPIALLGNSHTQIFFGLQHEDDIRSARKSLFLNFDEEAYLNILKVGECLIKIKNRVDPCLVKTPLVPIKKGIVNDDWLKIHTLSNQFREHVWKDDMEVISKRNKLNSPYLQEEKVKSDNQDKKTGNTLFDERNNPPYFKTEYARNNPVSSPEKINSTDKKQQKPSDNIEKKNSKPCATDDLNKFLIDIFKCPFLSITQRYKKLKFNPRYGNQVKTTLISQGCVKSRDIITNQYRVVLFDITKKGRMVLSDLGHEISDKKEGVVHKFWKEKIAEFYIGKGFEVEVEKYINGRPDIIVTHKDKKVAVEIETGKSDYIFNVERALKFGFDEVVSVATSKAVEEKIRGEVEREWDF